MVQEPVRVLVLYSHPLLGEGLERMLAAEAGFVVDAVEASTAAAVDAALARDPAVIVVEAGSSVDAADIVRRTTCAVVINVDITSALASTLRRESIRSRPEEVVAAIRSALRPQLDRDLRPDADRPLRPVPTGG